MLQQYVDSRRGQSNSANHEAERIVVHVKNDGSYQKNVEKVNAAELNQGKSTASRTQIRKK